MSTTALYRALLEAGTSEETAERAVEGLAHTDEAATKADVAELRNEMAALEVRLIKWNIATAIAASGVVIAAIRFI